MGDSETREVIRQLKDRISYLEGRLDEAKEQTPQATRLSDYTVVPCCDCGSGIQPIGTATCVEGIFICTPCAEKRLASYDADPKVPEGWGDPDDYDQNDWPGYPDPPDHVIPGDSGPNIHCFFSVDEQGHTIVKFSHPDGSPVSQERAQAIWAKAVEPVLAMDTFDYTFTSPQAAINKLHGPQEKPQ